MEPRRSRNPSCFRLCSVCVCVCCSIDRPWLGIQTNLIIIFISRLNPSAVCTWPGHLLTASHPPSPSLYPPISLNPLSTLLLSIYPPSILYLSFLYSSILPLALLNLPCFYPLCIILSFLYPPPPPSGERVCLLQGPRAHVSAIYTMKWKILYLYNRLI